METCAVSFECLLVEMEKGVRPKYTTVKWKRPRRNFEKGDLVLIVDDRAPRNDWNMARVVDVHPDSNGQVRSVRVTTATTTLDPPIDKHVLILEDEE